MISDNHHQHHQRRQSIRSGSPKEITSRLAALSLKFWGGERGWSHGQYVIMRPSSQQNVLWFGEGAMSALFLPTSS